MQLWLFWAGFSLVPSGLLHNNSVYLIHIVHTALINLKMQVYSLHDSHSMWLNLSTDQLTLLDIGQDLAPYVTVTIVVNERCRFVYYHMCHYKRMWIYFSARYVGKLMTLQLARRCIENRLWCTASSKLQLIICVTTLTTPKPCMM